MSVGEILRGDLVSSQQQDQLCLCLTDDRLLFSRPSKKFSLPFPCDSSVS